MIGRSGPFSESAMFNLFPRFAVLAFAALTTSTAVQAQQAPAIAPSVIVAKAEMKALDKQQDFLGRVQAMEKVDLRARVSGYLTSVKFSEGGMVKKGDVLFSIDEAPFVATLDQAKAAVAAAEASLKNAIAQLTRTKELAANGNASQSTLDQRTADESAARAEVLRTQAAQRQAEINLGWTKVTAPIDGRIGRALVTTGNLVGPDSGTLAVIVRYNPIYVLFPVTQRELLDARQSITNLDQLSAQVILANGSTYTEKGKIDLVDVQTNQSTDSVLVRAQFPNSDGLLVDGMSVRVNVSYGTPKQQLVIPSSALMLDQQGSFVLVVDADKKIEVRRIVSGGQNHGLIVIENGLKVGDVVVIEGQQRVRPGMVVTPMPQTQVSKS
ncbi:MAG: efflux RND transporter periplasmic adaptor subunit [Beijerinckiaceae bacterium]|nr:efflux RND transporter periplasmic adaptor subunit [Beijerinckiaceae bacterium]